MKEWLQSWFAHEWMMDLAVTLAHFLWQGCVVALLLALVLRVGMRKAGANGRYVVSVMALVGLVVWPVLTFSERYDRNHRVVVEAPWDEVSGVGALVVHGEMKVVNGQRQMVANGIAVRDAVRVGIGDAVLPWWGWLMLIWMSGMAVLAGWRMVGWLGLRRLRSKAVPLGGELEAMAVKLAQRMRVHARVVVRWSEAVGGPLVFGWWRPVVLLPMSLATGFTPEQIEMVLAHEFAHVRRQDYVVNLLQVLVETVLFFHPAVWWINRQIRREREHACDDVVVKVMGTAMGYARTLRDLAERALDGAPTTLAVAAGGQGRGDLKLRIERMLRLVARREERWLSPGFAWLSVLMLAMGLWLMPTGRQQAMAESVKEPAMRGTIRDRNGVALAVSDKPNRQVLVDLAAVVKAYRERHGGVMPLVERDRRDKDGVFLSKVKELDVVVVFDEMVSRELEKLGLGAPYSAEAMRREYRRTAGKELCIYREGLSEEEHTKIGQVAASIQGLKIGVRQMRRYPFNEKVGHITGYVSEPDEEEDGKEIYGVAGLEEGLDAVLKVGDGAVDGGEAFLTLDMRMQEVLERSLKEVNPEMDRGAAVLMEVATGDVLAMVSWPNYDPNLFVPSISQADYERFRDDWRKPLLNRAVRTFAPGAAYLPLTALAGISAGQKDAVFNCEGMVTYGSKSMKCWIASKGGKHGPLGMREGMGNSCNTYFYQLGNAAGIEKMVEMGKVLGFGQKSEIGLDQEDGGILPSPEWLTANRPKEKWSLGYTANTAIGQGSVLASPLQLTTMYAAIANGGTVWRPRLVDRVVKDGVEEKKPLLRAASLHEYGVTPEGMELLKGALEDAVEKYNGKAAASDKVRIAGRTGVAQNWAPNGKKDNHVWFCGYAPADKPKWALTVLVQGGTSGGKDAAPMAKRIFEQMVEIEAGGGK